MSLRTIAASALVAVLAVPAAAAHADALAVTCAGAATATGITWTATPSGGVAPYAYLWGNAATSASQTVTAAPGTHSQTITVTDASSTVASSTCSATVPVGAPTISAFTATPASIAVGSSTVLSWTVTNASSTSINHGLGTVSSTSVTVTPTVTTTYTLTATNPNGSVTRNVTVTVGSAGNGSSIQEQIRLLLAQINALKAQIAQLLLGQIGGNTGTTTPPVITPGQCNPIGRDITRGAYGDDVKDLQKFLAKHPNLYPEGIVNGFYGPHTMQAVKRWQREHNLPQTGFFGKMSREIWKTKCTGEDGEDSSASWTVGTSTIDINALLKARQDKIKKDKHGEDDENDDD
jgi:hypothetical protein